ncbi:MAG: hypothetical protein ACFFCW_36025 [Candidatus Hodarchaeota archaeon]
MGGSLNKPTTGPERHHADDGAGDMNGQGGKDLHIGRKKSSRKRRRKEDTGKGEGPMGRKVTVPCPDEGSMAVEHLKSFVGHVTHNDNDNPD